MVKKALVHSLDYMQREFVTDKVLDTMVLFLEKLIERREVSALSMEDSDELEISFKGFRNDIMKTFSKVIANVTLNGTF